MSDRRTIKFTLECVETHIELIRKAKNTNWMELKIELHENISNPKGKYGDNRELE